MWLMAIEMDTAAGLNKRAKCKVGIHKTSYANLYYFL